MSSSRLSEVESGHAVGEAALLRPPTADEPALDDRALALAFQAGAGWAFEEIYRRYHGQAQRTCRRYLDSLDDAEEAAQETMMRVLRGLPAFRGEYALKAWVGRIARNVSLDALRARARHSERVPPAADHNAPGPELAVASTGRRGDPSDVVESMVRSREVRAALERMPDHHRAALVLRDVEGLSHTEIGAALGISTFQAKALIHRARTRFKKAWTEDELSPALLALPLRTRLRHVLRQLAGFHGRGDAAMVALQAGTQAPIHLEQLAATVAALFLAGGAVMLGPDDPGSDARGDRPPAVRTAPPAVSPDGLAGSGTASSHGRAAVQRIEVPTNASLRPVTPPPGWGADPYPTFIVTPPAAVAVLPAILTLAPVPDPRVPVGPGVVALDPGLPPDAATVLVPAVTDLSRVEGEEAVPAVDAGAPTALLSGAVDRSGDVIPGDSEAGDPAPTAAAGLPVEPSHTAPTVPLDLSQPATALDPATTAGPATDIPEGVSVSTVG